MGSRRETLDIGQEVPSTSISNNRASTEAIVFINGKRKVLPQRAAQTTLLEYLRELQLCGTKLGCGEGGCGACTVTVSSIDPTERRIIHRAVNACLAPIYSVEGMHVITVEGLGSRAAGLHPVQEKLANTHGSQCGFCTPGFVMSMYSLLRGLPGPPSEDEIEDALAGNLCRCTGYRPILDAFRSFAKTDQAGYTNDALAAHGGTPARSTSPDGPMICPSTGRPCDCKGGSSATPTSAAVHDDMLAPAGSGDACYIGNGACSEEGVKDTKCVVNINGGTVAKGDARVPVSGEPIFPPELLKRGAGPELMLGGQGETTWHRPTSLKQLLDLKAAHPDAKLVVGNTEVGIEMRFKNAGYPMLIGATHVPELNAVAVGNEGISFGASVTLTRLRDVLRGAMKDRPEHQTSACAAIISQLKWFAGVQIRNVASMGGNIVTASPISDLNPLWIATRTVFTVVAAGGKSRQVAAKDFFLGYRKVDLKPGEILLSVFLPWTREREFVHEYKQAHRRDDDIAIVNAGIRARFESAPGGLWAASEVHISYGGVAALTVSAPRTAAALVGKPWTKETLDEALRVLAEEIVVAPTAPGGMVEFRRSLTASFLFKFFVWASFKLEEATPGFKSGLPETYRSAATAFHRPFPKGLQFYEDPPSDGSAVGLPIMHQSAELQVTGEAEYADDVPLPTGSLHGALVLSTRPHAKLLKVDPSPADGSPGFVGFYNAKDVPASNLMGVATLDEEVFATKEVTCVGQVIGIVVADTHENAKAAARKVLVEYEDLPAVLTIDDAIKTGQFIPKTKRFLEMGNVDSVFGKKDVRVVEGECRMGAQEHFYLEPNSVTVWPLDGGHEMHMYASTQCPEKHQATVASVLGLAKHKVVCRTKRIGGGFGGKETRSAFTAAAACVPSYLLGKPVRLTLDRDTDMATTGQRHPFLGKYKVAFDKDGKILAVELHIYNNGGNSGDLSYSVLERAMFHSDNVYVIPNLRIHGQVCFTNLPSNTAFRGFGGPQGMLITETWIEHMARTLGKPVELVKELNFQKEGHKLHYGQTLEHCCLQRVWGELHQSCDFAARRLDVERFNKENRWRKRGISMVPTKYGISFTTKFLNQAGALVHIYTDGTVLVSHGGVEMGQGLHTKVAQVAANTLGISTSSVFIAETATDKVPNASPTAASASSDMYGAACEEACLQLKERMRPIAEKMPGASFPEIVKACYFERINLSCNGFYMTPDIGFDWTTGRGRPFNYYTFGAAYSEIEIDVLTGDSHLLRTDIVMDLGRSINPAIDIGQVEGAFVQGMGWCALEEVKYGDSEHKWIRPGHLATQGPGTYKLPTANDIPVDFRVALLKGARNPRAVVSSKAVGEPPVFLASSVLFALKDAISYARHENGLYGFFQLDSPATPERIRMACSDEFTAPFAPPNLIPKLSV